MVIVFHNTYTLSIKGPGLGFLVVSHINFRTCDDYSGLICIEVQMIVLCIVADNVQGSLETAGGAGEQEGIVSDADCSGADVAKEETKIGAVETKEAWVDVDFEMATGPHMTLSVPLKFLDSSAELPLHL